MMKFDLLEVYAFAICGISVFFVTMHLGDLLYSILHMSFLNPEGKFVYGNALLKNSVSAVAFAILFATHWRLVRIIRGISNSKKK